MNTHAAQREIASALAVVRARCDALGAINVLVGADGSLISPPAQGGLITRWVQSRLVAGWLAEAVLQWNGADEVPPVTLAPGLVACAAPETRRRKRTTYIAALIIRPEFLRSGPFILSCQAASLDHALVAGALRPFLNPSPCAEPSLSSIIRWGMEDQAEIARAAGAMQGFSRQLADSFEEISLLYKLGHSMNELVQPERFVRLLCDELNETLAYQWVAAAFVADTDRARSLAGRVIHSGVPSSSESRVHDYLLERLDRADADALLLARFDADPADSQPDVPNTLVQPVCTRDGAVRGVIVAGEKHGDDPEVSSTDTKLIAAGASYLGILLDNAALYDDQQAMFLGSLKALTAAIDAKDRYTRGHSERVAMLTRSLAEAVGLSGDSLERVHIAGLVHDVGKIGVPESVLRKTGRLDETEFAQIKKHPEIGYHILKDIPQLRDILPGVLHHHERWDGRGYPHNLKGEDIPFVARLIALADSFDAMSSTRTYRAAMPRPQVLAEIERCAGAQFDEPLARAFVRLDFAEYDAMVERHLLSDADAAREAA